MCMQPAMMVLKLKNLRSKVGVLIAGELMNFCAEMAIVTCSDFANHNVPYCRMCWEVKIMRP